MSILGIQTKLAAFGAAILSFLVLYIKLQTVKNQRDRAEVVAETLKARHHVQRVQQKIKREEKKKLVSHKADIIEEIEKADEDFKGLDNLSNPNDF